ncbi:MAG TPA: hypothetical protein VGB85_25950, partial [Nannocystis sp.]
MSSSSLSRALAVACLLALAPSPGAAAPVKAKSAKVKASKAKPEEPAATPAATTQPAATTTQSATPSAAAGSVADPFAQAGSATVTGQPAGARESEIYGDRLDGIEGEVAALKDKIFRSKARLAVLRDTVMSGVMAGGRVVVAHRNLMSSSFRLVRVAVILDGAQIFARSDDTGALDQEDELPLFDGNLPPGPHEMTIELSYQGQGYGAFSYLKGYSFKSASSHSFNVGDSGQFKL